MFRCPLLVILVVFMFGDFRSICSLSSFMQFKVFWASRGTRSRPMSSIMMMIITIIITIMVLVIVIQEIIIITTAIAQSMITRPSRGIRCRPTTLPTSVDVHTCIYIYIYICDMYHIIYTYYVYIYIYIRIILYDKLCYDKLWYSLLLYCTMVWYEWLWRGAAMARPWYPKQAYQRRDIGDV